MPVVHVVKRGGAVARVAGADRYLERGAVLPDGVENLKHLLEVGVVEAVEVDGEAVEVGPKESPEGETEAAEVKPEAKPAAKQASSKK